MASQQNNSFIGDPAKYYRLSQQGVQIEPPIDLQTPLAYRDWLTYNTAVQPSQRVMQYNEYLQQWYQSYYQTFDTTAKIVEDYTELVGSLIKVFGDDSELKRISTLDLSDQFQLSVAIPYLSRKLRDIATYYQHKRTDIQTAKARYNAIGSAGGIQQILYSNLLRAFAKGTQTITIDEQIWGHIPQLSAVKGSFDIEVVDLFDETEYHDKAPDSNWSLENVEPWKLETGLLSLTSTNPLVFTLANFIEQRGSLFLDQMPVSAFDTGDVTGNLNIYNHAQLASKLIGTDQLFAYGGSHVPQTHDFSIDIAKGTNSFYWPYGEYYLEAPELLHYQTLTLDQTNFIADGATAGTTADQADIIWISDGQTIQAAWLKDASSIRREETMMAELKSGVATTFRFPFPGYGIISDRRSWTGKQLTNFNARQLFDDAVESQQLYWSDNSTVSTADAMSIHSTQAIACGAYASPVFFSADKIVVRPNGTIHDREANGVFNGVSETAWLYKPHYTQLAITAGETLIYWPYFSGAEAQTPAFEIPNYAANTIMLSSTDSTIAFRGAVAATTPDDADVIEMLDCNNVIMRAWLSGCNVGYAVPSQDGSWAGGAVQPGLNHRFNSGEWSRFIYDAPDREPLPVSAVSSLVGFQHEYDCPYVNKPKTSLVKSRLQVDGTDCELWNACTCKAVYYSPFGHTGDRFDQNQRLADVLMVDTQYPNPPNINTWVGRDGLSYKHSKDFAWFKANDPIEPEAGWGKGTWQVGSNEPMNLEPGVRYAYFRVAVCCDQEGPPLIISHSYCECGASITHKAADCNLCINPYTSIPQCDCASSTYDYCCKPRWIGMSPQADGSWISTGADSAMPLVPGQKYRYTHRDAVTYSWSTTADSGSATVHDLSTPSIDFLITQTLSGWGQDTTTFCASCSGAYPYWASTANTCFAMPTASAPSPYLYVTAPAPSRIVFANDAYLEYHRAPTQPNFIWQQPVTLTVNVPLKQWCELTIDPHHVDQILTSMHISNCSTCRVTTITAAKGACECVDSVTAIVDLGCNAHRIALSATDVPSKAILNGKTLCGSHTLISYCAQAPFSTTHTLANIVEPYITTPASTGLFVQSQTPWANFINRHYPTIATVSITDGLSTIEQFGLFEPFKHGTLTYAGFDYTNELTIRGTVFETAETFIDPSSWNVSRGLSQRDNNTLVTKVSADTKWMKMSPFSGSRAGAVKNSDVYQTFVPYQTFEQKRKTHNAFRTHATYNDLWNATEQSTDFHQLSNETQWIATLPSITGTLTHWDTDQYGNQFMLVKSIAPSTSGISLARTAATGTLWIRTVSDDIVLGSLALSAIYAKYQSLSSSIYNQLVNSNIVEMKLFDSTLMIVLSGHLLFEKLDYDIDAQTILTNDDATLIFDYGSQRSVSAHSQFANYKYAGHWFVPEHRKLIFATTTHPVLSSLPIVNIYAIDLQTHKFVKLFPRTASDTSAWSEKDSSFAFNTYPSVSGSLYNLMQGSPLLTYDKDAKTLVCHYIMHTPSKKHHFVTATWQMDALFETATLSSIDIKSTLT